MTHKTDAKASVGQYTASGRIWLHLLGELVNYALKKGGLK